MSALTIFTMKIFTPFKLTLWLMIGGFCQFLNQWTCAMGTNFSPTQALFMLWKLRHICMCGSSVEGPRDQAGLPWNVSPHEFHSPAAYFNSHLFHRHKRGENTNLDIHSVPPVSPWRLRPSWFSTEYVSITFFWIETIRHTWAKSPPKRTGEHGQEKEDHALHS